MIDLPSEINDLKKRIEFLESENLILKKGALVSRASQNSLEDRFLIQLGHEILNPLNGITGLAYLLKRTNLDELQKDYVKGISQSANDLALKLSSILNDFKLSEIFPGIESPSLEVVDNQSSVALSGSNTFDSLKNVKVLLAEDNEINQYLACELLKSWGVVTEVANNGFEAIKLWEENDYDIILMDIQMPGKGGIETTRYIRSANNSDKAKVPIIALTANSLKGQKEEYLKKGMNDHLSKPFNDTELFNKIFKLVKERKKEPETLYVSLNSSGNLFDYVRLEKISQSNKAFEIKLMNIFIETVPDSYDKLKKYWDQDDLQMVAEIAHKLKTTISSMGIEQLKMPVKLLEEAGKTNARTYENYTLLLIIYDTLKAIVQEFKLNVV